MGLPAVRTYVRPKSLGLVWARDAHGEWDICKGCRTVVPETREVPLPFAEQLCSECVTAHRCRCGKVDGHVEEAGACADCLRCPRCHGTAELSDLEDYGACADCVSHGEQHAEFLHQQAHAPGGF